jgi:hypothetical protein
MFLSSPLPLAKTEPKKKLNAILDSTGYKNLALKPFIYNACFSKGHNS